MGSFQRRPFADAALRCDRVTHVISRTRPSRFSACNIEKLGMGLGTRLQSTHNKHRVVKQFYFTAWPESGAPTTGAGMIDLIDQVIRTQQHTGNKPIIVHCR